MQPTLRDVGRLAGVHPATASRSLNPHTSQSVSPSTAERVRRAAKKLGYVPNPIARSLKTNRSATLGVLIPDLANPLFPPIMRGIEDVAAAAGYSAFIASTDDDPEREKVQLAALRSRQVEGLIVGTARLEDAALALLAKDGFPVVLINRALDGSAFSTVTGDDAGGVRMAVAHLAALGHRRIAHIAGPQSTSTGLLRLRAFRDALRSAGLQVDPKLIVTSSHFREADGDRALSKLLDSGREFSAVLAANDMLALGCYDALARHGLTCPDDVSVMGFNDMPFVDKLSPALTSIRVPHYEIGAEATRLLLPQLSSGHTVPKSVLLPVSLVVRASTASPGLSRASLTTPNASRRPVLTGSNGSNGSGRKPSRRSVT